MRSPTARSYDQDPHQIPGVLPVPASFHPAEKRIAIVCNNYSPHLTTKRCHRVAGWAEANKVEIAYTPTNTS
jgi:hypothetical protein